MILPNLLFEGIEWLKHKEMLRRWVATGGNWQERLNLRQVLRPSFAHQTRRLPDIEPEHDPEP